jgi:SAM-dependent methyltransferase
MSAIARWGEDLRARAVPQTILDAAPESPYGFPADLFRRRAEAAASGPETPTTRRAREVLPEGGSVLDVGCGAGATSLPLASHACRIVGVDGQQDMLEAFSAGARSAGVADVVALQGSWPEVSAHAPAADVVVCGHVLYNVAELEPFVRALAEHARARVIVEITARHPLAWMNDLWQRFHGLRWPDGPDETTAASALGELGFTPRRESRVDRGSRGGGFERREDAVALIRRRLCLPSERDEEIAASLGGRLHRDGELWSTGPPEQEVVTLWWDAHASGATSAAAAETDTGA